MNKVVSTAQLPALRVEQVCKTYTEGGRSISVLNTVDLTVPASTRVALLGASGSGKSTLLHLLGGLDTPDKGNIYVGDLNWCAQGLTETKRAQERNARIGFVYQFHHLLPEFTALENVAMPLRWRGLSVKESHQRALHWLDRVDLSQRAQHIPAQLSGGERQRVAVARALVGEPALILADEPTGNLDRDNAAKVFDLFLELTVQHRTALVLVTHDEGLAKQCDAAYRMVNGRLIASHSYID
jgi:lipoprotein-releasing system ATP-binding protein